MHRANARWGWHAGVTHEVVLAMENVREEVSQQRAQPPCCIKGGLCSLRGRCYIIVVTTTNYHPVCNTLWIRDLHSQAVGCWLSKHLSLLAPTQCCSVLWLLPAHHCHCPAGLGDEDTAQGRWLCILGQAWPMQVVLPPPPPSLRAL